MSAQTHVCQCQLERLTNQNSKSLYTPLARGMDAAVCHEAV